MDRGTFMIGMAGAALFMFGVWTAFSFPDQARPLPRTTSLQDYIDRYAGSGSTRASGSSASSANTAGASSVPTYAQLIATGHALDAYKRISVSDAYPAGLDAFRLSQTDRTIDYSQFHYVLNNSKTVYSLCILPSDTFTCVSPDFSPHRSLTFNDPNNDLLDTSSWRWAVWTSQERSSGSKDQIAIAHPPNWRETPDPTAGYPIDLTAVDDTGQPVVIGRITMVSYNLAPSKTFDDLAHNLILKPDSAVRNVVADTLGGYPAYFISYSGTGTNGPGLYDCISVLIERSPDHAQLIGFCYARSLTPYMLKVVKAMITSITFPQSTPTGIE